MGLDQCAHKVKSGTQTHIHTWRKHNRLQGWMEKLWEFKGGTGDFNCEDVDLTESDLDDLEKAIRDMKLPETFGFFFGDDSYEEDNYDMGDDLEFIKEARKALKEGWNVVYSSWY